MAPRKPPKWKTQIETLQATTREMSERVQALEAEKRDSERMHLTSILGRGARAGPITAKCVEGALKWEKRASLLEEELQGLQGMAEEVARARELEEKVKSLERKYRETLSSLRGAEKRLEATSHFLSSADEYSGADITNGVNRLNDTIYQSASALAHRALDEVALPLRSLRSSKHSQGQRVVPRKNVTDEWGGFLVRQIEAGAEEKSPTVLRSMIQSIVSSWCHQIIKTWCYQSPEVEEAMKAIWSRVREKYDFKIAKVWFTMLHSQLEPGEVDRSDVLKNIWHLMVLTGWKGSLETLESLTKHRFDEILELALKIRKMVSEGVLSVEFEVLYPERLTPFIVEHMDITGGATAEDDPVEWDGLPIDFATGLGVAYWGPKQVHVTLKAKVFMMP